jgi:hypothetical protein
MDVDPAGNTSSKYGYVQLWLKFSIEGDWVLTLTIPISSYMLRPLKWLRFLGFIIYGHEGVLYT